MWMKRTSYACLPAVKRYIELLDPKTKLSWETDKGIECEGIYKSMSLLVGATVRANEGYGMRNLIAVDA